MTTPEPAPKIHRGLKDVYFERSATTFIDGKAGELRYRGYSIHDLARNSTFEETAYLLLHGELSTHAQMESFTAELGAARRLPPPVLDIIAGIKTAHPWTCCARRCQHWPPSIPRPPIPRARPPCARASDWHRKCL